MKYDASFNLELKKNPYKGRLIAFEGIDGSGKSTQLEALGQYGIITHQPMGKGMTTQLIRKVLSSQINIGPTGLQYLFAADRTIHQETEIVPWLSAGKTVLVHRYFWSAIPYGLSDIEGLDYSNEKELNATADGILALYHNFILPDVTFYLDVSVSAALKRLSEMEKKKEIYEKRSKLEKIYAGYQWLLKTFPREIKVINAEERPEFVTKQILADMKI